MKTEIDNSTGLTIEIAYNESVDEIDINKTDADFKERMPAT
jgi:hypothetical protein